MEDVDLTSFTEVDFEVLKNVDIKALKIYLDLFKDYKVVMWYHADSGKEYPFNELPPTSRQCLPKYPEWFINFAEYISNIAPGPREVKLAPINYRRIKFFPSLIAAFINDVWFHELLSDGLCSRFIENGYFYSIVKRLYECKVSYDLSIKN